MLLYVVVICVVVVVQCNKSNRKATATATTATEKQQFFVLLLSLFNFVSTTARVDQKQLEIIVVDKAVGNTVYGNLDFVMLPKTSW